ncbi:MAG: sulfite exporter TauE/SafE family protein [Thalassobaculaceae bacterium]|nr:sulfite exporter TauE/SafE family protein [Thalassobaculaceae bacterium]
MTEFGGDLATYIPSIVVLMFTGAVAGLLAGLLGVGGGIVIVPVLFNMFGVLHLPQETAMHMAIGTSLATIIPTSIFSMRAHWKKGNVDVDLLKVWAVWALIGALIGTAIAGQFKGWVLTAIFAVIASLVAINMATRDGLKISDTLPVSRAKNAVMAFFIGGFSVTMGIGGGTLTVPTLSAFNYPIHRAVGSAAALGLPIAIPGVIGFAIAGWGLENRPPMSIGYINIIGFLLIFPLSSFMAPYGAAIAHKLNRVWLRRAFALFLGVTAVRMFLRLYETFS